MRNKIIGLGIILLIAVVSVATVTAAEVNYTGYQEYVVQIQSPTKAEVSIDSPSITISNRTISVVPPPEIVIRPEVKMNLVPKEQITPTAREEPAPAATPEPAKDRIPGGLILGIFIIAMLAIAVIIYHRRSEKKKQP